MDHTSDLNVSIIIIKLLGVSLIEENFMIEENIYHFLSDKGY